MLQTGQFSSLMVISNNVVDRSVFSVVVLLACWILYAPVNSFSVMTGWVSLG